MPRPPIDLSVLSSPGRRQPVFARNGMVATTEPLAAQAGLDILRRGGNAMDAAIATAAALCVVEPRSTTIGGDAFALIWDGDRLHGLNGSGRAPARLSADIIRQAGHERVPNHGWFAVTVPGAPAAWADAAERFGRLPLADLLEPAATYAEQGFPLAPICQHGYQAQVEQHRANLTGPEFEGFLPFAAPDGICPGIGDVWRSHDMAATLRSIGATNADSFYRGDIAGRLVAFSDATGGFLSADDLATHTSSWVDPICTTYRGYDVWEIPPNGQGIAALMALNILGTTALAYYDRESVEAYHLQIEAMKIALADAFEHVADPAHMRVTFEQLLSKDFAEASRGHIGERAGDYGPSAFPSSDTVYLCTSDRDGMMVSFIQSSYMGFGSHIVVPGTGFPLQNRGAGFSLRPGHVNELAGGKRPFHTIIPGFLTREGAAVGPFGVMGGFMQAQGHAQMMVNTLDYGMEPQTAIDAPRWMWDAQTKTLNLEPTVAPEIVEGLRARGHHIAIPSDRSFCGRAQIIWTLDDGVLIGATESRADGLVAAW